MSPTNNLRPSPALAKLAALSLAVMAAATPAQAVERKPKAVPARMAKPIHSHAQPVKTASPGSTKARAAEIYGRANFAMQVGQNAEAIAAFEQVVKLSPAFADAWGKLAFLYLKEGSNTKAVDAFKKAKLFGDANGGTVTRDGSRGLQFP